MPVDWTTWEDADALQQHFPHAAVWGQRGGNASHMLPVQDSNLLPA